MLKQDVIKPQCVCCGRPADLECFGCGSALCRQHKVCPECDGDGEPEQDFAENL